MGAVISGGGNTLKVKDALDVVSIVLIIVEMIVPLFLVNSTMKVGKMPIFLFIILANFIPFLFGFFCIMVRCVRAAERVLGVDPVKRFTRKMKASWLPTVILLVFLMYAMPFDPHLIPIGFVFSYVIIMTVVYVVLRLIEWRRTATE